jgi:CPA2 family monovalent cation:H+ antiporter-2
MIGYLAVGLLVGPAVLNMIPRTHSTDLLGEVGIIFLMFSLGLEFSLPQLVKMRQYVFGMGSSQVFITLVIFLVIGLLSGFIFTTGLAVAAALTMSSTAIVSKLLDEDNSLQQPNGQMSMGVLIFQDLAVIPLLIIIPTLQSQNNMLLAMVKALAIIGIVMFLLLKFGPKLIRPWCHFIARQGSNELFMANIFLIIFGVAYLTEHAGLSLSLGAFVAGMLLAETEYHHQIEKDIRPFKDILLGFFFITIGMRIEFAIFSDYFIEIITLLACFITVKIIIIMIIAQRLHYPLSYAIQAALLLAGGGEFGFVVLQESSAVMDPLWNQISLAAILFSMLMTPVLARLGPLLAQYYAPSEWPNNAAKLHPLLRKSFQIKPKVIILGYGQTGQMLLNILESEHLACLALEINRELVKQVSPTHDNVVFGDANQESVLLAAGIMQAQVVIVTMNDARQVLNITERCKQMNPQLQLFVRSNQDSLSQPLYQQGATEVVSNISEGSFMLATHVLLATGKTKGHVLRLIQKLRQTHYHDAWGFFKDDDIYGEDNELRLLNIQLEPIHFARRLSMGHLRARLPAEIIAWKQGGSDKRTTWMPDECINDGDILTLCGQPEQLRESRIYLESGNLDI